MPEPAHRSYLFAPGSNTRILGKVLDAGADAVVLDLEDAVAATDKASARSAVADLVRDRARGAPCAVHVRIDRDAAGHSTTDVDAVVHPGLAALRLPKCTGPDAVRAVDHQVTALERERGIPAGTIRLYPTIESAAGVLAAGAISRSSPRVAALVFGSVDFAADLGLPDLADDDATLLARSTLALQSRAAGIGRPVDGAFTDLADEQGLRRAATRARRLGFAGKSAVHPTQLPVLHEIFTPSPAEIARARAIVAGLDDDTATAVVGGAFVDAAVVAQARRILATAREPSEGANR
ncbi:HpcH/HpaI aldolase/citrate lyase family protein [Jiangella asiatica]|uniref:HpcH/HpaI aldolase/citrate lyase family protein n=1 Tax=Jiangella asiatica TaxID=2530372 RepID=UPI0013A5D992|nr:CoA ester lyase [Jiangella asiatica]